jgi:hypothetical protein
MFGNNKIPLTVSSYFVSTLMLAAQAAAFARDEPAAKSYGMTSGRLAASSAAVLGLVGAVIGLLALVRPQGRLGASSGPFGAILALALGLIGMIAGGVVVATSGGRIGTGGGLAGAVVALILGLISTAAGALLLSRSRRNKLSV